MESSSGQLWWDEGGAEMGMLWEWRTGLGVVVSATVLGFNMVLAFTL